MRFLCGLILGVSIIGMAHADQAGVVEITDAHAAFIEAPSEATRTELLAVLSDYDGTASVETVQAYLELMASDSVGTDHAKTRESALATMRHIEPISDLLSRQYYEAKYIAAIAYFNGEQNPNALLEMAQVKGFTTQFYDEAGEKPDWAETLRWRADAWGLAMEAYFASARIRYPSESDIQAVLASYGSGEIARRSQNTASVSEASGLPQCAGELSQRPKIRFPSTRARRGMFGAVILRFGFDAEGQVVNPEILASVPQNAFDETVLTAVENWRYKPDRPRDVGKTCALVRSNVVLPITFQLN